MILSHAEVVQRGWFAFSVGVIFLGVSGLQLWFGKAVTSGWFGITSATRASNPSVFWSHVIVAGMVGVFGIILGLSRIL